MLNPEWSAASYIGGAKTFVGFYAWLSGPGILPIVNFINEWGLVLLGASLLIGLGIKLSGRLGALLMVLYWLPILEFPYVGAHSYLVDEHVIYVLALLLLASLGAGRFLGLANSLKSPRWFD